VLFRSRGRLRRLTIGDAKTIGLADAREEAREAIRAAAKGGDPATEKKRRRSAQTIDDLIPDSRESTVFTEREDNSEVSGAFPGPPDVQAYNCPGSEPCRTRRPSSTATRRFWAAPPSLWERVSP